MKKQTILFAALFMAAVPLSAQQVREDSFARLGVHYDVEALAINTIHADDNDWCSLSFVNSIPGGEVGTPTLPLLASIIEVPVCKDFKVSVTNAVYDTVSLTLPVVPMQASISKSDRGPHHFTINREHYETDAYSGADLASVEYIGVARDRHMARLVFSPVRVNSKLGKAIVCRSADVTVEYVAADEQATNELYSRYHTPAYSAGTTLNSLPTPKYVSNATPVRFAVLTISSLRCNKLEQYFSWKRQQGFRVDVFYIDELGIQSNAAIDAMLKGLYTDATESDPAPAYLLVIGDVAQVPTHASRVTSPSYADNDHVTDLYYTTWSSGDNIPDCYHGRFSATDTVTLGAIIDKTILYESYQFADDSYLARAALIAGEDYGYANDNAYTYADPAMDYAAKYYVNHANGYDTVTYYKNRTSFAPAGVYVTGSCTSYTTAGALRSFYNQGAGWINYSAHGNWNCWGTPEFTVSHANQMSNTGKPTFMIGNCCLTNKFEKDVCLGEAVLRRRNNAGAIGYIGGSNSTYWGEDFSWEVGVRSNVSGTMDATYDANNLGSYDRLFHTHGEALNQTATTAGKIMFFGNMAVQSSGSSLTHYYWEIYHLMGDPSLMPWLGRAEEPYVMVNDGGSNVYIGTVSGAYVAVVDPANDYAVVSATFADAGGNATLTLPASHASLMLSVTAQGYKPYHHTFNNLGIADAGAAHAEVYPNPASSSCTINCLGMRSIRLVNSIGQTVRTIEVNADSTSIDLQGIRPGVYIAVINTECGNTAKKLVVR